MNIKTTKKDIEELGLEVLTLCPVNRTDDYVDGYIEYVSTFIEDIKFFYGMIENVDGSCYVDFEYTCETTNRLIKIRLAMLPLTSKEIFLSGSLQAEINIVNAFHSEFVVKKNNAA